ncbi:hypothetical protein LXL04_022060 [Taraxacum kok-saghyz]
MAPINGRAVLVFRARCGCSVGRMEVLGPKKKNTKKIKNTNTVIAIDATKSRTEESRKEEVKKRNSRDSKTGDEDEIEEMVCRDGKCKFSFDQNKSEEVKTRKDETALNELRGACSSKTKSCAGRARCAGPRISSFSAQFFQAHHLLSSSNIGKQPMDSHFGPKDEPKCNNHHHHRVFKSPNYPESPQWPIKLYVQPNYLLISDNIRFNLHMICNKHKTRQHPVKV